jgi:hypothetical protein
MADFPRCASCRVSIEPGQNVVFRPDGRVQHAACPEVVCPACARPIKPQEPIRRDGDGLVHSNCWLRLQRGPGKPAVKIAPAAPNGIVPLIRSKLAAGTLPRVHAARLWAGPGKGDACAGCDQPITPAETEHEVDVPGRATLRFHRNCLSVWQAHVARDGHEISGGSTASPWTSLFDLEVARRAASDRASHGELLAASAESCAMAAEGRARSARVRARTRQLLRTG